MYKFFVTLILSLLFCGFVNAQTNSLIYYLKNSGKLVSTKDSADYWMLVDPPDTAIDKNLYVVHEYYKNGKTRLITGSKTNDLNLKYEGNYISYFPNGHRSKTGKVEAGQFVGSQTEYYPNGQVYTIKEYQKIPDNPLNINLKECRDSTGHVLTANGNGKWVEYDENFKYITDVGKVQNGQKDSVWIKMKDGKIIYKKYNYSLNDAPVTHAEFRGGLDALENFIIKNLHYPKIARENGTTGKVVVTFSVEPDGNIDYIYVVRGIGDNCDEEVVRIIKSMPKWKPAKRKDGSPIAMGFSLPVDFSFTDFKGPSTRNQNKKASTNR